MAQPVWHPPLDLSFLADVAASGQLTKDQEPIYPAILAALENEHPEMNLDDYRRGIVAQDWDILLQCNVRSAAARTAAVAQITADELRPSSQAATDALRGYLEKMSLPQREAVAPILVIYGGKDALIPVDTVDRALALACSMGDVIDIRQQPDKGHDDLDYSGAYPWIADRFNDVPAPNSCAPPPPPPAPPASSEVSGDGA